jgi:transposase InsO family protein
MDYFTKWLEVYAIPNQKALTIAGALVTNFFCRFGIPRELHSDQGRNFESHLLQDILQRLGVNKMCTMPLHPQLDGMVERYIKTIKEHLQKVVASHQRDWDESLPLSPSLHGIHSRHNGLTPAKVVFGREL